MPSRGRRQVRSHPGKQLRDGASVLLPRCDEAARQRERGAGDDQRRINEPRPRSLLLRGRLASAISLALFLAGLGVDNGSHPLAVVAASARKLILERATGGGFGAFVSADTLA